MRYKFNKLVSIIVVFTIICTIFASCGDSSVSDSAADKRDIENKIANSIASKENENQQSQDLTPTYEFISHTSVYNDMYFDYPSDWVLSEDENVIILYSEYEDAAIMLVDISYEITLFLAGHGDMETSVLALMDKYSDFLAAEGIIDTYTPDITISSDGEVIGETVFSYTMPDGTVYYATIGITQVGGRVIMDLLSYSDLNNDDEAEYIYDMYLSVIESVEVGGTDYELTPANLSDLGLPEAPAGFERFYSPVSGQFFIYPDTWEIVTTPYDYYVMIYNDSGAIMITENWTDSFYDIYNSNGNDEVECFDYFLEECAGVVESFNDWEPDYYDFEYMTPENQELIKATFNYDVPGATGRCFAEFGVRTSDDIDYIQGTLCMYAPGDSYSIDMFSIIMDSTLIYFPEL